MSSRVAAEAYLFEQLVGELLKSLGFMDVIGTATAADMGFDLQATYPAKSPTGAVVPQLWLVVVKHRRKSRISTNDFAQLLAYLQVKKADKALLVTSGNLTSAAKEYASRFNGEFGGKLEIWDRDQLTALLEQFPDLLGRYQEIISDFPRSLSATQKPSDAELIERLTHCPPGQQHWREFERVCVEILTGAFVPPLKPPREQARTWNGLERRDALFSLRGVGGGWQELRQEFEANFLLCEFKNYSDPVGKDEVNQTRNYLKRTIGRIGVMFSRKGVDDSARRMRNSIYAEEQKVILFFEDRHLIELLQLRAANQDPLDLIQDAIEEFYISYE
jgi:hypothetical protein